MAQDVHPEIRTEAGETIPADSRTAMFGRLVARILGSVNLSSYPLLSGIDPYGETMFNGVQLPRVVLELRGLAATLPEEATLPEDLRVGVEDLAEFVSQYADGSRWYLWFIGD